MQSQWKALFVLIPCAILLFIAWLAFRSGGGDRILSFTSSEHARPGAVREELGSFGADGSVKSTEQVERTQSEGDPAQPRGVGHVTESEPPTVEEIAVVTGDALDSATGEGIPFLTIDLEVRGVARERLTTDATGAFKTRRAYPEAMLVARASDAGTIVGAVERYHEPGTWDSPFIVGVPIGPTCPINVVTEDRLVREHWQARIVESVVSTGGAGEIEVLERGLRVVSRGREPHPEGGSDVPRIDNEHRIQGAPIADRRWPWLSLRDGVVPWIRYPKAEYPPEKRYVVQVELRDLGRAMEGSATLTSTVGIQPAVDITPVEIPDERSGTLVGRIVASGRPVQGATVVLLPTADEEASHQRPPIFDEVDTDEVGEFTFDHVPPSERRIVAYTAGREPVEVRVRSVRGVTRVPDIQLGERHRWTAVEIEFENREPRRQGSRYYSCLRLQATGRWARSWYDCDRGVGGGVIDHFSLPLARLVHLGVGHDLVPRWTPSVVEFETLGDDGSEVRLEWVEIEDLVPIGFEVEASEPGHSIATFFLYFGPGGSIDAFYEANRTHRWRVPIDAPVRWTVWAPGYAPVCGSEADLELRDGESIGVVKLEEGWGGVLYFRAGDPNTFARSPGPWDLWAFPNASESVGPWAAPPVPGIGVDANGERVGFSDADGRALLQAETQPVLLQLEAPGWRIAGLEPLPYQHRTRNGLRHAHIVWMVRR